MIPIPSNPPRRAWIRLPSGNRLDLINPDPQSWTDQDLIARISRVYRWGGESVHSHPLSVAQHSLTVLALRRQWSATPLTAAAALLELMHDAEEAFIGVDMISTLKPILGKPFRDISASLSNAVADRYNLPYWQIPDHQAHKRADCVAAATEAFHCIGWSVDEIRNVLGISHPILTEDPLATIYGCTPWEPWTPDIAALRFGDELAAMLTLDAQERTGQKNKACSRVESA